MKRWWTFGYESLYNMFAFVYEFTVSNDLHLYFLTGIENSSMFLPIYGYISANKPICEMVSFILNISRGLTIGRSQYFINSFYSNIN